MKSQQHQGKKQEKHETIYPERYAEIDPCRRDVQRIARAPERAITDQGEGGLSGKDVRARARHGIVSSVREETAPNEQQRAEDARWHNREGRDRPRPVMHNNPNDKNATNQDGWQNEDCGAI
jgi:hypothetical protein